METDTTGSWTLPEEYVMSRDTVRRFMERGDPMRAGMNLKKIGLMRSVPMTGPDGH